MNNHTKWAIAAIVFTVCVVSASISVQIPGPTAMTIYTLSCFVGGAAAGRAWQVARRVRQARKQ